MQVSLKNSAEFFVIDDGDAALVAGVEWRLALGPGWRYVVSCVPIGSGYAYGYLHRHITSAPAGTFVDHRNGDTLDNRRENLRMCTHGQNMMNRKAHVNSTSGIPNVRLEAGRYLAEVKVNYKKYRRRFGCTEDDKAMAIEWAKAKRMELHGEFAADHRKQLPL